MFSKADLIQREVEAPFNKWCACGHVAPTLFKRNGPDSPEEPTRFFLVSGQGINNIYCEICLIVANFMSKNKNNISKR